MTKLQEIAGGLGLTDFVRTSEHEFNLNHCHGNRIIVDEGTDVWYHKAGGYTITIGMTDGEWYCEVTDDEEFATGIAQSDSHSLPASAWEDTRQRILDGKE